ncbi:MAG: response regulator, partial [Phycisphaerae bacterium]
VLGFSLLLKAQGHEVRTAYNGLDVVRTAAEFHPHVIMLDIGLPGLNGYEVAKLIRGQPFGSDMTLIALTGYGQDSDRRTSTAAGFNYHLVKPARFEQLLQILSTVEGD